MKADEKLWTLMQINEKQVKFSGWHLKQLKSDESQCVGMKLIEKRDILAHFKEKLCKRLKVKAN